MFEKILVAFKKLFPDLKPEQEQQLKTELEALKLDENKQVILKIDDMKDGETKKLFEALNTRFEKQDEVLKQLSDSLKSEKEAREKAEKDKKEAAEKTAKAKVEDAVKKLVDDGKISTDEEKTKWQKRYENDFDDAAELASSLVVKKGFKPAEKKEEKKDGKPSLEQREGLSSLEIPLLNDFGKSVREQAGQALPN